MEDSYRHKGMRRRLVQQLEKKGIRNKKILAAIGAIPRHFFLDSSFERIAYDDRAFPIGEGQTISQPYTVAFQTELLEVKKRQMIMEIGTGSGYQAMILALLGARVFTIERHEKLAQFSKNMFKQFDNLNIRSYFKDGYKGLPEFAPFDRIIVTAAAPKMPETLKQQLKIGGILVVPVGGAGEIQEMCKIIRKSETEFEVQHHGKFRFVPFLEGTKAK